MKRMKRWLAIMLMLQIGSGSVAFTEIPPDNSVTSESVLLTMDISAGDAVSDMPARTDDAVDIRSETENPVASAKDAAVVSEETALLGEIFIEGNDENDQEEPEQETTETEVPQEAQLILSDQTDAADAVPADEGEKIITEGGKDQTEAEPPLAEAEIRTEAEFPSEELKTQTETKIPPEEAEPQAETEIPVEGEIAQEEMEFPAEEETVHTEKENAAEIGNNQEPEVADETSIPDPYPYEETTEEERKNSSEQICLEGDEIAVVTQVMTGEASQEGAVEKTETAGAQPAEELTGATQYGDIQVSEVSVSAVPTNPKYSKLVFTFKDESTNQTYRCLMTGLKTSESNTTEGYDKLAYDVALNFLSGQTLPLSAERMANRYGLEIELIDAEKQDAHAGSDTNLCWGASAADMIEFAGWNVYASEDEAFADLSASFNNLGGTQQMAIKWYVDGINPHQLTDEEGKILYENTTSGASQQLSEGTGGYWKQYAAPVVSPDNGAYDEIETLLKDGVQKLEQGYALGIGVYTYRNNANQGLGHSLTVFGYIGELLNQTIQRISALFVADSDNDAYGQNSSPSERTNTYTMYKVQDYSNGNFDSLELNGYKNAEDTHVVIGTVTSMAPRQTAPSETAGTKNPQEDVNLVPVSMEITNSRQREIVEANAGDTINVSFEITNESYSGLPANATAEITMHITWNGIELTDVTRQVGLKGMEPLENRYSSFSYDVLAPGTYTFQMEITSVKDASGNPISEAYVSDNLLQKTKQVVVKAVQPRIGPETESPAQNIAPAGQPPVAIGTAEKIYKLQVTLGDETTYLRDFSAPVRSRTAFMDLRVLKTREVVNPKSYQITMKDGKFQVKFAELFLRMLKPGNNDFELLFNGGRILFRIIIL